MANRRRHQHLVNAAKIFDISLLSFLPNQRRRWCFDLGSTMSSSPDAVISGLAGAGGGIVAQLLTYPLLTVNTRQQTDRNLDPTAATVHPGHAIRLLCQVAKQEGWHRLYGGLAPSLVGTAASQGVYYYFYQIFWDRAENVARARWRKGVGDGTVGIFNSLVIAALSGCINVLLTNPIWVVVTRMQTHPRKAKTHPTPPIVLDVVVEASEDGGHSYGTSHVVREVYNEAGVVGFWKGVFPTLIMVSNPSIQFMLYETLLKKLKERRSISVKGADGITALDTFLLGALAKLGATVATYPLLVVKSRLQAKQEKTADKRFRYRGTLDCIAKMIRYEGLSVFYKGMSTKMTQSVLAAAVLFMVKEELVKGARLLITRKPDVIS